MVPPFVLVGVLVAAALTGAFALFALAATKLYLKVANRREARWRSELREFPVAIASGRIPDKAPPKGKQRYLALEMMVETVSRLKGRNAVAARLWFEANGFVDEAIKQLDAKRGWQRARAAYRLGRFGSPRAEPYLAWRLKDPRYEVRDAAVRALGRIGGPDSVGPLLDAVEQRRVARGLVSGALLELSPHCDLALAASLRGRDTDTRRLVAQVIGLRGRDAGPALLEGLRDTEPEVRRESALALARLGQAPEGAELELRRLARDERPWVRASAATALGALLGDGASAVLLDLVGDEDFWAGYRAAEALVSLPSGPETGWRLLMAEGTGERHRRARARCLELLEQEGHVHDRLERAIAEGGDELEDLLAALERAGSRAWSGV